MSFRQTASNDADSSDDAHARLRQLPSVDTLVAAIQREMVDAAPRELIVQAARQTLDAARRDILSGEGTSSVTALVEKVQRLVNTWTQPTLRPIINATGVVINTNLGRSPLAPAAVDAIVAVAGGYSNLEYNLDEGERGSRHAHVRSLLRALTGAEDALVVNNNASAVLVVLSALAAGGEVIVSRGELVEIGGGFRVPDVMRQSGATLVEVGTTNRTRARDFEKALSDRTSLLLAVHPSNFRVVGFTEAPTLTDLAHVAHARKLPLVHDLGSGCLVATEQWGLAHEPMPQESISAGVDVVCFSGDKLLGGPQAGIIVGRASLLERIAVHPLMRAVRMDKLTLAALEATLRLYRDGRALSEIPIWRAISAPRESLLARATRWTDAVRSLGMRADVVVSASTIGGGSLPGSTLETDACSIPAEQAENRLDLTAVAQRLRAWRTPLVCRVSRDHLLLDPRTVLPEQDEVVEAALREVLSNPVNS